LPQYGQKKEKVTSKGKKMTAAQLAAAKEVETKAGQARGETHSQVVAVPVL
jgi:hypothetical protein